MGSRSLVAMLLPQLSEIAWPYRREWRMTGWAIAVEAVVIFALAVAFFSALILPASGMIGVDGYFHFKIARLIWQDGPWVDISWLPYTVLGKHGPDHAWLWHVLMAPFALIKDQTTAIKWATIINGALVPATLTVVGRLLRIPYAPVFALLAICAGYLMPGRILMLRTQNIAIIYMALAFLAFSRRWFILLGVVTFLFVESYNAAVILGLFLVLFCAIGWIRERQSIKLPLLSMAIGGILGLLLSPWFPANVEFLFFHILFKVGRDIPDLVGTEWMPITWKAMLIGSWQTHLLLGTGLLFVTLAWKRGGDQFKLGTDTIVAVFLCAVFLVMYHSAWRFAEYYIPFGCLTSGLLLRDSIHLFDNKKSLYLATMIGLVGLLIFVGQAVPGRVAKIGRTPADSFGKIARYLNDHAQVNDMVFNSHYPNFVLLCSQTNKVNYVAGLDGHFLYFGSPKKFKVWYDIKRMKFPAGTDLGLLIEQTFNARWAVIPKGHAPIAEVLNHSKHASEVMHTPYGWLFKLTATAHQELKGSGPEK
jgi:hypothetical protein